MSDPKYIDIGRLETRVIEECSELIKALCKVDRFGWQSCHPKMPGLTNHDQVMLEIDDVIEACNRLKRNIINRRFE